MTKRYLLGCSGCGAQAPLTGAALSDLSDQVVAFRAEHDHAGARILIDPAPQPVVIDLRDAALVDTQPADLATSPTG